MKSMRVTTLTTLIIGLCLELDYVDIVNRNILTTDYYD